jgi:hypothetical protein
MHDSDYLFIHKAVWARIYMVSTLMEPTVCCKKLDIVYRETVRQKNTLNHQVA